VNFKAISGAALLLMNALSANFALSQMNNYAQTNLVSNVPGLALTVDDDLLHPWGMAVSANQPFRVAENGKGKFKSYDASGAQRDPRGIIAVPSGVISPASPTGVAANTTSLFVPSGSPLPSPFLFATRQGTISGEYADGRGDIKTTTILVFDRSSQGAEYTGLALLAPDCCAPFLAAADFHHVYIETITSFFDPLGIPGAFIDPNLPSGYSPWNIVVVGDRVFVTYALQDSSEHDPVVGAGNGIVDIYNLDGSFVRRFASNGPLNVPSGVALAPANFGAFSNDILIGNFGDGLINAFDPNTGEPLGTLKDGNGNPIADVDLHSLIFGDGSIDNANTLYLTAGLTGGTNGLFAAITLNTSGAHPDFSISATPPSVTISAGQAATFSVTASPVGNFRGQFTVSCSAPTGLTCSIGSQSVNSASGSSTVSITAAPSAAAHTASAVALVLPGGLLLAGLGLGKRRRVTASLFVTIGFLSAVVLGISGCSSYNGSQMTPQPTTQSLSITVTSGAISHSTLLTVSVQ
jgi:uncharacterized protein (TIGR03118 family)